MCGPTDPSVAVVSLFQDDGQHVCFIKVTNSCIVEGMGYAVHHEMLQYNIQCLSPHKHVVLYCCWLGIWDVCEVLCVRLKKKNCSIEENFENSKVFSESYRKD